MPIETLTSEDVAGLFGWSPRTFANRLRQLVEAEGFPARLPGGRWYAPAVADWMARRSGMAATVAPETAIDRQRNLLEQIYGKGKAA